MLKGLRGELKCPDTELMGSESEFTGLEGEFTGLRGELAGLLEGLALASFCGLLVAPLPLVPMSF